MHFINTSIFMGLSIWIFGFALMTAGWLVEVLFERYGAIPGKILYKSGAILVAVPVIYLLWKTSSLIYSNRVAIVMNLRAMMEFVSNFTIEGL